MLKQKRQLPTYNDGWIEVCREKEEGRYTDWRAKKNVRSREDVEVICRLAYAETSKRQQDLDFADARSFTLSMKIRTRRVDGIDASCKVIIGDMLFDICWIDPSKTELFLYLQEARTLVSEQDEDVAEDGGDAE